VLKSYTEGTLSMTLGAWLIFTETYTTILDASLTGANEGGLNIEWVDDAFFGYICTAKVDSCPFFTCACLQHISKKTC
jgi:hypothetical protein